MKLLLTVLFALSSVAVGAAENLPFVEDFSSLQSSANYALLNEEDSRLPGWKLNNCWEMKEGGVLFVGNSSGLGWFTTTEINMNGKTRILLEMKRGGNVDAAFTVSASNGVKFAIDEFSITNDDYCVFTLYILDGVPNTTITISGIEGKFYLTSMKVYDVDNANDINDAIFYESFDNVNGSGGNDGSFTPDETVITNHDCSLFDNSSGATHQSVHLGNKCIYITSTYYTTPTMNVVPEGQVVLSYRVAGMNNYNYTPNISVSCINGEISAQSNLSVEHEKWNTYYVKVNAMTPSTQFTFNGVLCFLDEIKVTAVPSHLHEAKDNMIYITANAAQTRDVQLIRTLTPNIWCPLCLPFDVTQTVMNTATGTTCELCTLSSIDDGVFKFEIASTTIAAGTPFLVRVNETVTNPVFTGVTIVNTPAATATASTYDYKFVGTYSPVDLETNGTNLFLATDGELYIPASTSGDNRLAGLRAYFVVPPTANTARVMIPETTSNISSLREESPSSSHELYDLRGQRVNNPNHKGIYIHKGKRFLVP